MNHLDKNIKQKLANRTFTPSASAWERLEVQLSNTPEEKKKKGWLFFAGIAASIAVLITVSISFFINKNGIVQHKEIIVENTIDTLNIKQNINKMFDEVKVEEAVVNNETSIKKEATASSKITEKENTVKEINLPERIKLNKEFKNNLDPKKEIVAEATSSKENVNVSAEKQPKKILKKNTNNSIKINSDDLLYAVTHSQKEVDAYYVKHQISREDVLKTIKNELKKSDINIKPETILAEVERSIGDEDFQNNFMKSLKKKVSDIATAFASRNN
jgi:hypothetical protein